MQETSPPPHQPNVPAVAPPAPAASSPIGPDDVMLLIDDRAVVAKKGTTVLQAAEKAGVQIGRASCRERV